LREKRSLRFAWDPTADRKSLPFVIRGVNQGIQTVMVRFFDDSGNTVTEKQLRIKFEGGQS